MMLYQQTYRYCRPLILLCVLSFGLCLPAVALSAEKKGAAPSASANPLSTITKSSSPLQVTSDRMEVDQKDKTTLFEGHVVVKQDDMTITGNRLKVFSPSENKGSSSAMMDRIDRIEVEGDVKITQANKVATAEKSVYYHKEQKILLMGHPVVSQGEDRVSGRLITLYLAEDRSVVEGGEDGRVEALLHPNQKGQ